VAVEFQGNEAFPDDSLRSAIVNRPTECETVVFQILLLCPLGADFAIDRRYLAPREIPRDSLRLELYYYQRGYREAQVDTSLTEVETGEAVRLGFAVEEGRPVVVDSLAFVGLDGVEVPRLRRSLPLREGAPLSGILLDATRDTLRSRLRNAGYAHADIIRNYFIPNDAPYAAEVEFDVATGPRARFGPIVFDQDSAAAHLSERSLRRMLPFDEGDVYSQELIYQAQRNLFGLEIVRTAAIEQHLDFDPDSLVPLTVRVSEGDVHRVRAGVGVSTADCVNTEATWSSRNFMGGARRLQIRGRVSNLLARDLQNEVCRDSGTGEFADVNWLLSAELFQPWFFSTRNALTLSVFAERQSLPDVFVRRAVGVTAALTRTVAPGTPLNLSYRPQLTSLDAAEIFFCSSFLVCTPQDIDILQRNNWLAPVSAEIARNRTNNLLSPSDGYQLRLELEHASTLTGSDFAYNRIITEASIYQEMARRTVWAGRVRLGWVAGGEFGGLSSGGLEVIHPQKRFYAGGANSVRGFAQNRLGPRVLTTGVEDLVSYVRPDEGSERVQPCTPEEVVDLTCRPDALPDGSFAPRPQGGTRILEASVEYRFAFGGDFQAALFTDVGQVWAEGSSISPADIEVAPGIGVRYFSPIGPIRVDIGYRFRGAEDLQVVTNQLQPAGPDDTGIQVTGPDGDPIRIPWVETEELALLDDRVRFGSDDAFSFRNLQLHFSIGQAF
jgi:outer membrane protein insertion porin family/translocation and assembly module TamA